MTRKSKTIIAVCAVIIAIAGTVIAVLLLPKNASEGLDISSMLETAQKYLLELDYTQAIAEFEKIIEVDPMNADAYLGIAEAYEKQGDIDKALEWLEKGYKMTGDRRLAERIDILNGLNAETETEATTAPPVTEEETTTEETVVTAAVIVVPDVVGLSTGEAVSLCEQAGITYKIINSESDTVEKGYVISQTVPAGTEVGEGAVLNFFVSNGVVTTTVTTTTAPVIKETETKTTTTAPAVKETETKTTITTVATAVTVNETTTTQTSSAPQDNITYEKREDYADGWYTIYHYNSDKQISALEHYDKNNKLIYEATYSYNKKVMRIASENTMSEKRTVFEKDTVTFGDCDEERRNSLKAHANEKTECYSYDENGFVKEYICVYDAELKDHSYYKDGFLERISITRSDKSGNEVLEGEEIYFSPNKPKNLSVNYYGIRKYYLKEKTYKISEYLEDNYYYSYEYDPYGWPVKQYVSLQEKYTDGHTYTTDNKVISTKYCNYYSSDGNLCYVSAREGYTMETENGGHVGADNSHSYSGKELDSQGHLIRDIKICINNLDNKTSAYQDCYEYIYVPSYDGTKRIDSIKINLIFDDCTCKFCAE